MDIDTNKSDRVRKLSNEIISDSIKSIANCINNFSKAIDPELNYQTFSEQVRRWPNEDVVDMRNECAKTRREYIRHLLLINGHVLRRIAFKVLKDEIERREIENVFIERPKTVIYRRWIHK